MPSKKQNKNQKKTAGGPDIAKLARQVSKAIKAPAAKTQKLKNSVRIESPPVTIGTSLSSRPPTTTSAGVGALRVTGREFLCNVGETSLTTWYLGAIVPLHPAYYPSSVLGNHSRAHSKYKINSLRIHYITRQPTSASGEILMWYNKNISDPCLSYSSSDLLAKAMSSSEALLGPIWTNHTIQISGSGGFMNTVCFNEPDLNDNIMGELYVFSQSAITDVAGYLVMDYDITFKEPQYSLHSALMPIPTGISDFAVVTDSTTTAAGGTPFITTAPAEYAQATYNGAILKFVFSNAGSTYPTGNTPSNLWALKNSGSTFTAVTALDGLTMYAVVVGSTLFWYPNITIAKIAASPSTSSNSVSVVVYNQGRASNAGSYAGLFYLVQFPPIVDLLAQ